jgi:hypothetical protein
MIVMENEPPVPVALLPGFQAPNGFKMVPMQSVERLASPPMRMAPCGEWLVYSSSETHLHCPQNFQAEGCPR